MYPSLTYFAPIYSRSEHPGQKFYKVPPIFYKVPSRKK